MTDGLHERHKHVIQRTGQRARWQTFERSSGTFNYMHWALWGLGTFPSAQRTVCCGVLCSCSTALCIPAPAIALY
jgi:hypothetical protein